MAAILQPQIKEREECLIVGIVLLSSECDGAAVVAGRKERKSFPLDAGATNRSAMHGPCGGRWGCACREVHL